MGRAIRLDASRRPRHWYQSIETIPEKRGIHRQVCLDTRNTYTVEEIKRDDMEKSELRRYKPASSIAVSGVDDICKSEVDTVRNSIA